MRKKCALYTGKYGTCNESLFMVGQKFEFTNLSYFTLSNSIISLKRIESLLFSIPHTSYMYTYLMVLVINYNLHI